jgi:hypothetical protein
MGTTNLFVELVVIGVGAMIWLCLLVIAVFGWKWIPVDQVFSTVALVPLVSLIYLLGIISDRIADSIFERLWVKGLQQQRFASTNDYHLARRQILTGSERLSDLLEYGRSRMRICRGWTLNSILVAITLNLFVWIQLKSDYPRWSLALFGTIAALSFALGAWYTWYKLSVTEYRKVKEQAAFLVEKGNK